MKTDSGFCLKIRLTSWEKWGFRTSTDYTREGLEHLKNGGFNGIFVGGGSGLGPDAISPEMFVASETIPDLMPESRRLNEQVIRERMSLTRSVGLESWILVWGVPGPDESEGTSYAVNSRTLDRRLKLEMRGLLARQPELFGYRNPKGCNWRGSRPLCLSHSKVRTFYREIFSNLCRDYPELSGIVFFPGDHEPEVCDHTCPRCSVHPGGSWGVYIDFLNEVTEVILKARSNLPIYVIVWNPYETACNWTIKKSHPACGIILPFPDIIDQERRTGRFNTAQPWMSIDRMGDLTAANADLARHCGRNVMALHEFCQSEVYDPVRNFPLPGKTLRVLKILDSGGFSGVMDFWGDYPPVRTSANLTAMREYLNTPENSSEQLLHRTAAKVLGAKQSQKYVSDALLGLWEKIEETVDEQAYFTWFQRLNAGIGRQGARGHLYLPLIPNFLDLDYRPRDTYFYKWANIWIAEKKGAVHGKAQFEDRDRFNRLAGEAARIGELCRKEGLLAGGDFMGEQALSLRLYASLIASIGRSVWALQAYSERNAGVLRECILDEIQARSEQIRLTEKLGCGINRDLVQEDVQLMLQFLSSPDFPDTSPEVFTISPTPYLD